MDATLSFVMANMAQCQPNHIALDPFCGTGKFSIFLSFQIENDVNESRWNSSCLCGIR
jgi:tRNA G10  N-methylase Trm11